MKKLKHNKLRNTGLLFEILSKNVMYEVVNQDKRQTSLFLIKKHFNSTSELLKELSLYQSLQSETKNDCNELLQLTLESRNRLDLKKLEQEKYNLIRHIKKHYNLEIFFETRTTNYKLCASIFKLFENFNQVSNPDDYLTAKSLVLEHLSGKKSNQVEDQTEEDWRREDPDIRTLGFKILLEKFNDKYRPLNLKQKTLLGKYINEDVTHDSFKNYVMGEVGFITNKLTALSNRITDEITKIKLNETINLAQTIISSNIIKDDHLTSMLKYYELIDELEK